MGDPIEEARELKRLARARRATDPNAAEDLLQRTIAGLEAPFEQLDAATAAELADLHGVLGGTLREEGEHLRAAAAYDAGFRYEADPRYALSSTYNALNRLVERVLLCPAALSDPEALRAHDELEHVDVPAELNALLARLQGEETGSRSDDFWAAGDLALVSALIGDEAGARSAAERFAGSAAPPGAFAAYGEVVDALARLDTPRRNALTELSTRLDRAHDMP
jgi:hypothetical protein